MNIYFELSDFLADKFKHKYYFATSVSEDGRHMNLMRNSERVWAEQGGVVWYLKNRHVSLEPLTEVDMKEFMWIKLQSVRA